MALPSAKQKCYICSDEVTDAEYRRELTCSYTACPGSDHAYHEECMNEYLRKQKLPVDRLIGYSCPALLDNGRPCTGRITATHHRHPLNLKKKQKRVDAAAAAAAMPKPKQQAQKPKDPNQLQGAAAAVAAMRQAGVTNQNVVVSSLPTVKARIILGPGANSTGPGQAVSNNSSMAPERVVRQRVIPGWSGPKKGSNMSTLEQQRAQVAALRAEAKAAAGRGTKVVAGGSAGSGYGGPSAVASPAAGQAAAGREGAGRLARHQLKEDQDDNDNISDADSNPFVMWTRDGDSSDSVDGGAITEPTELFQLGPADFPAFPSAGGGITSRTITPVLDTSPVKNRTELEHFASSVGSPAVPQPATPASASDPLAAAASASRTAIPDDLDPVVAYYPLCKTDDDVVVVQDEFGNWYRLEDLYGPHSETIECVDESGALISCAVIRQSLAAALQAQHELMQATDGSYAGGAMDVEVSEPTTPPAALYDTAFGAEAAVADGQGVAREHDSGGCDQYSSTTALMEPPPSAEPDEEEDLDDLFALCVGGSPVVASVAEAVDLGGGQVPPATLPPSSRAQEVIVGVPYDNMYDAHVAQAEAPAGCFSLDAPEGDDDVSSLLQLLCV